MTVLQQKEDQSLQLFPPFLVFPSSGLALDKLVDTIHKIDRIQQLLALLGKTTLRTLLTLFGSPFSAGEAAKAWC
jgi:hypothetical protein